MADWSRRKVLIIVRTYPSPSHKEVEVSCTAAITDTGEWIRIFPVPYRFLEPDQRFKKYQWIEADLARASDHRVESHKVQYDTIKVVSAVDTKQNWAERKRWVLPLTQHCMCCIQAKRTKDGFPTLGVFRPKTIKALVVKPEKTPDWTAAELAVLRAEPMFRTAPSQELEKIPYQFRYQFECDHPECRGHDMMCTDWEMAEAYRRWRSKYGEDGWLAKFRQKWETAAIEKWDTHFYVGTVHGNPGSWIIVGLFNPLVKPEQPPLF